MRLAISRSRLRFAALVVFVLGAAPIAARGQSIILLPHWQPEQQKRLEMISESKRLTGKNEALVRRVRRLTDLRITSVEDRRILLTWTDRDYEVTTGKGKVTDPPIEVFKNEPIELTLNGRGQLAELRNWETVRRLILKAQDKIDALARDSKRTDEQVKEARAQLEQSLATEELVRAVWANREGTYFYFYGLNVPSEGALESEQDVRLPVGGAAMKCNARITAERVADNQELAKFHFEMLIDPEQVATRVRGALQELARQGGRDPNRIPMPKVEMIDRIDAEADMLNGWVLSFNQYRKTVVSGTPIAQIETVSYKMQDRAQP